MPICQNKIRHKCD